MVLFLLCAATATAQTLEWRGDATLGARLYDLESPFDDDVTGWFDQYRYVRDKDSPLPYFVDLTHLDVGLARDDDTHLLRLERWSPWDWNDRAELGVDGRGFEADLDYWRYRSEELRLFPVGTGATLLQVFGTVYNPDASSAAIFQDDHRLERRRTGVAADLALRLNGFDLENPLATELDVFSRYEHRSGHEQDGFLLDAEREPVAQQTERFRGFRRELDQYATSVGAGAVLLPWQLFTADLEVAFESFRENAPVVTLGTLYATDPAAEPIVPPPAQSLDRAFSFVPDTNRWSGSLRLSRRFDALGATVHGGGFLTHLAQAGRRAPLQDALDLGDDSLTTWSSHGAFDVPLGERVALGGFAKWLRRENGVDEGSFAALADGQVDPVLDQRSQLDAGLEATARPAPGALAGLGYRLRWVDRELDFADPPAIRPEFNLLGEQSEEHTTYLRGSARLLRSLQLSGEAGYAWAPQVGFPRDLERSVYARARGSTLWRRPLPGTLALYARFLDGENDDVELTGTAPDTSEDKDFERTEWAWGATVSAVPHETLTLFASFHDAHDEQDFAHVRSDVPRYLGPADLDFFLDSKPQYRSEVRTLVVGGTQALGKQMDLSLASILTFVRARFAGSGVTPDVLEEVDELESRIVSLEGRVGWRVTSRVSVGLGYRFDAYRDDEEHEALSPDTDSYDTDVHTLSFDVTVDLAAVKELAR